jgi:hypothetical protein
LPWLWDGAPAQRAQISQGGESGGSGRVRDGRSAASVDDPRDLSERIIRLFFRHAQSCDRIGGPQDHDRIGAKTAADGGEVQDHFAMPAAPCGYVLQQCHLNLQTFSEAGYPGGFYAFVNSAQTAIIIPPLDNTQTSFCPGGSGQYVYLQVFYAMPLIGPVWLPAVTTTFQGQKVKLVSAAAAFKNDPYQSTYTAPAGC